MIARFDTWEQASIFAGKMQSEGRHAVMLDEGTLLWGALAIGGVRVWVSDIVLDEDGEWPAMETVENEFANALRGLIMAFACSGPLLLLGNLAIHQAHESERPSRDPMEVLVTVLLIAGGAGAILIMGPLMPAFTRFLRDDESVASRLVRLVVVLILIV
jgi:hypothetical protein